LILCPLRGGAAPHLAHGSLEHMSQPANGISIGLAVFVQLITMPNTQTDRQTDRPRYVRSL